MWLSAFRHICILLCYLAWRYFQDDVASKSRNHSCSSFWSNDLTWKVQGFWFGEASYTDRASYVKENFPKILARKDKALAMILLSVGQPFILFLLAGR